MARTVHCVVLKREAEGLEAPPHPGELGQRIYENVSKEGWQQWLERLTMIINENGLSTADPASLQVIEQHMVGFLFDEGEYGGMPQGFRAAGGKK
ncbi:MAG TPA: oxidative damage protection protein [Gammaproteobacteria bacterium]|nr:oxidative damage protection protein [Gammaproteobacteria bacterium]